VNEREFTFAKTGLVDDRSCRLAAASVGLVQIYFYVERDNRPPW